MPLSVAVAGASGYAGGELLRILSAHPELDVQIVTGHSSAGRRLGEVSPHLRSLRDLVLGETTPDVLSGADVVFLALPHGASAAITAALPDDVLVVDCGADHRLESAEDWSAFYGTEAAEPWAYGVPELPVRTGTGTVKQRERLVGVRRIAAPGCNASTVALSLAPGIAAGVILPTDLVSVLAVGPSGAGKALKPHLLAAEILGSASTYAVGGTHRHIPEIRQALRWAGAADPTISFTPVLVPMSRGVLATSTAVLAPGVSAADVRAAWESAYAGEPFVELLPEGEFPRTADVLGANTALLGLAVDAAAGRVVVIAAVDNLVKGTAGAAVQSLNIALGLPETLGLSKDGIAP
ncbi:MAG: N-acetyl-gamma-glutamyl-phosphate reductase [Naasia sp.]|jgi:N-acetyl-gamma-glutamyl-phosphate reductase|uniref:N-acetyl-gamma-glutamyl-phosphate reductase n=1 Tax=Naasia sp. TaxID=2546198 RepID=UPI002629CCCE|nr:N-acetyl-gamma-glutamyl-phosphate reductase [Naasia sp.]MCU1571258.1 N-acetyl-gamma-glutamyl-phosphate reductase [Naasia sp.]